MDTNLHSANDANDASDVNDASDDAICGAKQFRELMEI